MKSFPRGIACFSKSEHWHFMYRRVVGFQHFFFGLLVALTCDLQLGKNQKVLNIESVLLKEGQVIIIWLLWVLFNFLTLTRCLRFLLSRLVSSHLQGSKKQMSLEAQLQNLALISKYQIYVTSPKNICFEPKYSDHSWMFQWCQKLGWCHKS